MAFFAGMDSALRTFEQFFQQCWENRPQQASLLDVLEEAHDALRKTLLKLSKIPSEKITDDEFHNRLITYREVMQNLLANLVRTKKITLAEVSIIISFQARAAMLRSVFESIDPAFKISEHQLQKYQIHCPADIDLSNPDDIESSEIIALIKTLYPNSVNIVENYDTILALVKSLTPNEELIDVLIQRMTQCGSYRSDTQDSKMRTHSGLVQSIADFLLSQHNINILDIILERPQTTIDICVAHFHEIAIWNANKETLLSKLFTALEPAQRITVASLFYQRTVQESDGEEDSHKKIAIKCKQILETLFPSKEITCPQLASRIINEFANIAEIHDYVMNVFQKFIHTQSDDNKSKALTELLSNITSNNGVKYICSALRYKEPLIKSTKLLNFLLSVERYARHLIAVKKQADVSLLSAIVNIIAESIDLPKSEQLDLEDLLKNSHSDIIIILLSSNKIIAKKVKETSSLLTIIVKRDILRTFVLDALKSENCHLSFDDTLDLIASYKQLDADKMSLLYKLLSKQVHGLDSNKNIAEKVFNWLESIVDEGVLNNIFNSCKTVGSYSIFFSRNQLSLRCLASKNKMLSKAVSKHHVIRTSVRGDLAKVIDGNSILKTNLQKYVSASHLDLTDLITNRAEMIELLMDNKPAAIRFIERTEDTDLIITLINRIIMTSFLTNNEIIKLLSNSKHLPESSIRQLLALFKEQLAAGEVELLIQNLHFTSPAFAILLEFPELCAKINADNIVSMVVRTQKSAEVDGRIHALLTMPLKAFPHINSYQARFSLLKEVMPYVNDGRSLISKLLHELAVSKNPANTYAPAFATAIETSQSLVVSFIDVVCDYQPPASKIKVNPRLADNDTSIRINQAYAKLREQASMVLTESVLLTLLNNNDVKVHALQVLLDDILKNSELDSDESLVHCIVNLSESMSVRLQPLLMRCQSSAKLLNQIQTKYHDKPFSPRVSEILAQLALVKDSFENVECYPYWREHLLCYAVQLYNQGDEATAERVVEIVRSHSPLQFEEVLDVFQHESITTTAAVINHLMPACDNTDITLAFARDLPLADEVYLELAQRFVNNCGNKQSEVILTDFKATLNKLNYEDDLVQSAMGKFCYFIAELNIDKKMNPLVTITPKQCQHYFRLLEMINTSEIYSDNLEPKCKAYYRDRIIVDRNWLTMMQDFDKTLENWLDLDRIKYQIKNPYAPTLTAKSKSSLTDCIERHLADNRETLFNRFIRS